MEKAKLWGSKRNIVQVEKSKKIVVQAKKYFKWKGLRIIFSPSISYQVLDFVEEEIKVTIVQMMAEKTNGSPSEDIQQFIKIGKPNEAQEEGDERNVDASLRTQEAIVNVFGMFD